MSKLGSKPDHGSIISQLSANGIITEEFQIFFDEIEEKLNRNLLGEVVQLTLYAKTSLPIAANFTGGMIYVTDEVGGAVPAFSDGINWRRCTDRAIVS